MTRQFLQHVTKLEKRYVPYLIRIITAFRKKFIADLKAHGKSVALSRLQSTHMNEALLPLIHSIYKTAGLFGARMTHEEIRKLATQKAGGFGRNETWIRDVQAYLRLHALGFVMDISDTMRNDILAILEKGVKEGWSIEQTVKELLA